MINHYHILGYMGPRGFIRPLKKMQLKTESLSKNIKSFSDPNKPKERKKSCQCQGTLTKGEGSVPLNSS